MYLDLDWPEVVALVAGVLLTGSIGGILAGLLGVGGGIVVVPVLFWLMELLDFPSDTASHLAVATSLATIIPTSISSMRAHAKRGTVDTGLLKLWGPLVFLGALIGGILSRYIPGEGLRAVFGVVGIIVAVNMAIPKTLVLSDHLPASRIVNGCIAGVIGFISSLMGIGGGTLSVPTLSLFGYPVHKAVGTAAALGLLIALPAVAGFIWAGWDMPERPPLSLGYVNLAAVALIAPVSFLCAPLGARLAHAMNARYLKMAFAFFLFVTAVRMLMS
ncbi:sulfite exporter TauE/SafE family protein [Chelativorans sp. AA-79]|uniref:sulfite exporter TauE/SafE family protein n=1 Tax=Chelativorans sp. AA-79 TaxID=3028735 RepID=UPI0023F760A8|nr:sulfite exporter TauE/SafE family protein [Chelativorans sp. AA-79]WEX08382.1 sulfite exporter TauE/SafE family protein [Chelativorans sp. AA-79]